MIPSQLTTSCLHGQKSQVKSLQFWEIAISELYVANCYPAPRKMGEVLTFFYFTHPKRYCQITLTCEKNAGRSQHFQTSTLAESEEVSNIMLS